MFGSGKLKTTLMNDWCFVKCYPPNFNNVSYDINLNLNIDLKVV